MIQSNPDMKTKSKVINGHSSEVGMKIYDKSNSRVKSEFVNFMHNKEQNQNEPHDIDLEKEKKMLTLEQADEEERKRDAIQFLTKEKERRSKSFTPGLRVKVNSGDRHFLQELVYAEIFDSTRQHFPKGSPNYLSHIIIYFLFFQIQ